MNSERFVCRECGKVISIGNKRRHKERCWPRMRVRAGSLENVQ